MAVFDMLQSKRPCADIAQQMQAIESTVITFRKTQIHDHIDRCVEQAAGPGSRAPRTTNEQLKEIAKCP